MDEIKIILDENEIPKKWYNIQADLKNPLDPPLNPKTKETRAITRQTHPL